MTTPPHDSRHGERGLTLVVVLLFAAIFLVLVGAMLLTVSTQREIAVNDEDWMKSLDHAETGLSWAERRILDTTDISSFLEADDEEEEDSSSTSDANLLGLRDLSLTATSQFTSSNEGSASAIVDRDFFGDGTRSYEVVRLEGSESFRAVGGQPATRAHLYVRIDDNPDETPNDPGDNDPESDTDGLVRVTAVSEYPIFVDGAGQQVDLAGKRPPARRAVVATYSTDDGTRLPAIATNGTFEFPGNLKLCGDCGSAHANDDIVVGGSPQVCKDLTAYDRYSGSTSGVGGEASGNRPWVDLPIVNPYDPLYLPTPATFDTSGDSGLPAGLRCPLASASDPGANKFFAFVADNSKGRVFKAYWNTTLGGWTWTEIDDLADGTDVRLDDCGRVQGVDPNFGDQVADAGPDEFFGFKGDKATPQSCTSCSSSDKDDSLCDLANNDYGVQTVLGTAPLPGPPSVDGTLDYGAEMRLGDAQWDYSADTVYSPLYNAVIWVYGNVTVSGNPANSSSVDFRCGSGAGCSSSNVPYGLWKTSFLALGDIVFSGQASIGPANPAAGYHFQFVAGRDIAISGNPNESESVCHFGCSTDPSFRADDIAGIWVAHEQIQISGSPNLYGQLLAEDAIDCSSTVDARGKGISSINGNPRIQYDCGYPPNPWDTTGGVQMVSWQEIE